MFDLVKLVNWTVRLSNILNDDIVHHYFWSSLQNCCQMINEKLKHYYYDNILCLLKKSVGKVPGHHQWFCGQMGSCSLKIQYLNFKSHYLKLMLVKRIGKYCILKHVNNCSCSTSPNCVYHLSPIQKQLLNP